MIRLYGSLRNNMITPGIYQHFKGGKYEVIGVAHHTETNEELVVYRALEGDTELKVRPLAMFCEEVSYPDGSIGPRFRSA